MTFVVDNEALRHVFLRVHQFYPVSVISAVPYAPLFLSTAFVKSKSGHTLETFEQSKAERTLKFFSLGLIVKFFSLGLIEKFFRLVLIVKFFSLDLIVKFFGLGLIRLNRTE